MSWQNCMETCLPPIGGAKPVVTSPYGKWRTGVYKTAKLHKGVDFAYPGGKKFNLRRPVHTPTAGKVTRVGGGDGIVKILDSKGYSHEFVHMVAFSVSEGQMVSAGQKIGSMGGRQGGNDDARRPHVHYQLKRPGDLLPISAVDFWDGEKQIFVTPSPDGDDEIIPNSEDAYYGGWTGEPSAPSGNVNDYMPRQAGVSEQSASELALWTNRVPQHEPWARTLMVNTTGLNTTTEEHEYNTRHNPQFTDDTEAGSKGIGRVEGDDEITRGPFWRR
jgi:murein DD-endopeptidase MepM/ murein hydrolase activator NlpD